jgi:hypothetical protein
MQVSSMLVIVKPMPTIPIALLRRFEAELGLEGSGNGVRFSQLQWFPASSFVANRLKPNLGTAALRLAIG